MTALSNQDRIDKIKVRAANFFGKPVIKMSAPGGEGRSSYRVIFDDRSIIATLRPNFRRTHVEAFVLRKIGAFSQDLPECLGVDKDILFQSDVGGDRLNLAIVGVNGPRRHDLAQDAVAAIFRIQSAAQKAGLQNDLPHLGQTPAWIENFVHSVAALEQFSEGRSQAIDLAALCERIACPAQQFVKWDCRSGNAAVGPDGHLRWFDFEYAGVRHGSEDIAWLLGDEAWPVAPDVMEQIVVDAFDPNAGYKLEEYLSYLSLYLTFHCIQRLKLIVKEAARRGWLSKTRIRKYDDAGVHPEFAAHICRVGRHFADRDPATRPIARDFEDAEQVFLQVLFGEKAVANG